MPYQPLDSSSFRTGLLKVAGLTELQARNLIVNSSSKYIQDPQITVRVLGYRSMSMWKAK